MRPFVLASLLLIAIAPASLAESLVVREWSVIGPFELGSREGLVHPLAEADGRLPATWDLRRTWPSALAGGGRVAWTRVTSSESGAIALDLGGVDWEARQAEGGGASIANVAVLVGAIELASDALLLVDAARCGGTIGGRPFMGDPYGAGIARSVVRGRRGRNEIVLTSAGHGPARSLSFRVETIDPAGDPLLVVTSDLMIPDAIAGSPGSGWAGVPLLNLTDRPLDVRVRVGGSPARAIRLAPMAPMKVAVASEWAPEGEPGERPVETEVLVEAHAGAAARTIRVTASQVVRSRTEARRETFRSGIDLSAQEYGLLPSSTGPGPGHALVMSTHGAGVGAVGQAASYGPKERALVVAPTNRRPFGFDWHDWGRLDFEEVLAVVRGVHRVDPDRVHLTGHSMGGHGAWILGALHADEFASVSPSAGWAGYDSYMPFTQRRSTWLASPELNALLLRALAPGRASPLLENLAHVPVRVLHGGADDNVPPTQGRMLAGLLERLGGDVAYREVPERGHWWDADEARPGADAVDDAWLGDAWSAARRDPLPRRLVFSTPDPDIDAERHWLRIERQETTASESRIEADATSPSRVVLATRNVTALSLRPAPGLGLAPDAVVVADGEIVPNVTVSDDWITLRRAGGRWVRAAPFRRPAGSVHPGGLAKALFGPFTIVVPTAGDAGRCESMAALGRLIATAWWVRGNGFVEIVRDADVTPALRRERRLVLLGGADLNAETALAEDGLLVRLHGASADRAAGAELPGGRRVPGADLACAHWQPHPLAPESRILVLQGGSPEADALLPGLQPIAAGLGLPDFVVATPRVRLAGFGGFAAAGFWSPDWGFDPASAWLAAGASGPSPAARAPASAGTTTGARPKPARPSRSGRIGR